MPLTEEIKKEVFKELDKNPVVPHFFSKGDPRVTWVATHVWDYLDHMALKGEVSDRPRDRPALARLCKSYIQSQPEYLEQVRVGFIPVWIIGIIINIIVKIILDLWLKKQ
jgi:hypothetical protein